MLNRVDKIRNQNYRWVEIRYKTSRRSNCSD